MPNERAKSIFLSAAEIADDSERSAFLDERCGNDTQLRGEIQELLQHRELIGSFLESPPVGDATTDQPVSERPGTQIGPYKLREQIGEGGFGIVFVAEQTKPVRRKVALKVIKPGMDTKDVIARFEAERQALALMDHPHVARVLDAGATESGRPYFVMELVQGVPITDYCDSQKLSTKERLRLFVDVCQAVQHAHQKGIIHRDIKPSNVMVTMYDHRPVVKVIDFGIAKAVGGQLTEKTIYTAYGQMVGTPMYMSPEQAQMSGLDADTRSDVYSLGVLLYELLTGTTPFDKETLQKAGFDEMRRIILEEEPRCPSVRVNTLQAEQLSTVSDQRKIDAGRLSQSLRGELDWIVMKGLEKDRGRRYETAASLANDVDRHLNDEAVQACPPTLAYRLYKFSRRHKAALGVAASMVLLLLAGSAATAWQAVQATYQRNRAVEAEQAAERGLEESEVARKEAEAISDLLTELLKSPRPKTAGGGRNVRLADLLDELARRLDGAKGIRPDRIAGLQADLASTYSILGRHKVAAELRERVFRHHSDVRGPDAPATIDAKMSLAAAYRESGRVEKALAMHKEVLAAARKATNPPPILTVRALGNLATSYAFVDRRQEALELREEALQASRNGLGDHVETFHAMTNLTRSYVLADRLSDAVKLQEAATALGDQLFPADQPERLRAWNQLANAYELAGRDDDASKVRLGVLSAMYSASGSDDAGAEIVLADFERASSADRWKAVNDNVMGGRSKGGPEFRDGRLVFTGETVTQGGGFCSTRIQETDPMDLSSADAVRLRVKGDGRRYLFEMRTKAAMTPWNAIPYRAAFATTAGQWIEVNIPLDKLKPTRDGFGLGKAAPAFDRTDVRTFGFMIADGNNGPFRLEVDWVKAVPAIAE